MADNADKTVVDFRRLRDANLPAAPSSDGDYIPLLTVASGVKTVQWVDASDYENP